jgi:uncharacterized protein DUF6912
VRVYIPATTSLLQRLVDTSEFGSGLSAPGSDASAGAGAAGASVEGSGAAGPDTGEAGGPGSSTAGPGVAGPGAAAAGVPGAAAVELTAFAVTPGLREWYVDDDLEELEYAASREAARASLRLLAADPAAAPRRVVVAADVPDTTVTVRDDLDRGVVRLTGPVPLGQIAAAHVDDSDAEAAVRAASAAIDAADLGDADAEATVDDAEGFELAWYATQELGAFLELLGTRP